MIEANKKTYEERKNDIMIYSLSIAMGTTPKALVNKVKIQSKSIQMAASKSSKKLNDKYLGWSKIVERKTKEGKYDKFI